MPAATSAKSTRGRYSHFEPESDPTRETSGIAQWKAPIFMTVAFAAAVGLAVGHHYMGLSLADKPVDEISVSQAWIFRFSAALAFLVKTALTIGIGTAYVQQQWLRFQRCSFKLNEVDALVSVLGNALSFFESAIWLQNPKLMLIALVSL
jgi:hypothetical protein